MTDLKETTFFSRMINAAKPWKLLTGFLFYALGAGVLSYLGDPIDFRVYALGQAVFTCFQGSSYFLAAYYDAIRPVGAQAKPYAARERRVVLGMLQIALVLLTAGVVMALLLIIGGDLTPVAGTFLILIFLLFFLYGTPPVRLAYSGYGELSEAILLANLSPAFAFLLQTGSLHRLLGMVTFPLTGLYLAMLLVLSFRGYAADVKYQRGTLLQRIGWQQGMVLHNILILAAYALIVGAALLGLPWGVTWPALLTLPLGIFQIWQMIRVADGAKPPWRLMILAAVALPVLTVYFLMFTLITE